MEKSIIAERMKGFKTSVFSLVDDLYKEELAKGRELINLSIGNPDISPPQFVRDKIAEHSRGGNYGYAMSRGHKDLLTAVGSWYKRWYNVELDAATEVHSLMGSQDGLAHISLALVNPGDVVLVPDPGYPIFSAGPLMAGAELYKMPLLPENAYLPDLQAIPAEIYKRTKMLIVNYPNNPLAAVAPREFFEKLIEYAKKYKFIICHDFAYSDLLFDGEEALSFLSIPGAKEVGVEFTSMSKSYSMAGARIGFVAGNSEVIAMLGKIKSNFDYGIFLPMQYAVMEALLSDGSFPKQVAAAYQERRDALVNGLRASGWDVPFPPASMYVWAKIPYVKGKTMDCFDFVSMLIKEAGVVLTPGDGFGDYGRGYVRMALVQPVDKLKLAAERIGRVL